MPVPTTTHSTPPTITTTTNTMSLPHIIPHHTTVLISPLVPHPLGHPHTLLDHHTLSIIPHIILLLVALHIITNIPIMPPTMLHTTQLHTLPNITQHTMGHTVDTVFPIVGPTLGHMGDHIATVCPPIPAPI